MSNVTFHPLLIFVLSFAALWLTAWVGAWLRKKEREQEADFRDDFGVILAATLTLLALIIGFSFSMATTRYDQRKNYEEQEANAIGTCRRIQGRRPPIWRLVRADDAVLLMTLL